MNSRRRIYAPKLRDQHRAAHEYFNRGDIESKNHWRSAQPMSLMDISTGHHSVQAEPMSAPLRKIPLIQRIRQRAPCRPHLTQRR